MYYVAFLYIIFSCKSFDNINILSKRKSEIYNFPGSVFNSVYSFIPSLLVTTLYILYSSLNKYEVLRDVTFYYLCFLSNCLPNLPL